MRVGGVGELQRCADVAGRPSMGKTTFAMNLVENAVLRSDKAIVVYSLEMPSDSIVMRMLASLGRIDQTKVRAGRLDDDDCDIGRHPRPLHLNHAANTRFMVGVSLPRLKLSARRRRYSARVG
jgi:hypothetical protein